MVCGRVVFGASGWGRADPFPGLGVWEWLPVDLEQVVDGAHESPLTCCGVDSLYGESAEPEGGFDVPELVRPEFLGGSRVWKDEGHDNRNHTRKADDASVYEAGEGSGGSYCVRAPEGTLYEKGHGGSDRGPTHTSRRTTCTKAFARSGGSTPFSQDASRTRFECRGVVSVLVEAIRRRENSS